MRRANAPLLVFFLVLLLCAPCSKAMAEASGRPVVLGMSAAFSGPSRNLGIELYRGAMAYLHHVNDNGGLLGRPVTILTMDDGYNPNPAILNTKKFIEDKDVLLLFNYVGTPTVTRVLPLLKIYSRNNVFLFFPFTGAQPQREAPYGRYVFNLRDSYRQETQKLVNKFLSLNRKRIAVFYQADAYGRSGWDGIRRALKRHGMDMVGEATYRRGAKFSQSMLRQAYLIRDSNPDAVISVGSYEACAAFIRDARDAGIQVPIANLSFVGSESLLALLQRLSTKLQHDYTQKLITTQVVPSYEDDSLPAVRQYRELMQRYADRSLPFAIPDYVPQPFSFVSFEGFLNAKVLVQIIRSYGKIPTRDEIHRMMNMAGAIDIGIDTPVVFDSKRHQGLRNTYFTTVVNGRFLPITDWSAWTE
jgi:ABC-type branched-subunit amino acid transport system substrate-binding protein